MLSDHHYWGGLRRSSLLAGICDTFGLGLSMHSNSHLGISLAAMTHLAAATPNLNYACDTHWPWKTEDVIVPGALSFTGGSVTVPTAPGLGVELDRDALARLHEQYLACGVRDARRHRLHAQDRPGLRQEGAALVRPRRPGRPGGAVGLVDHRGDRTADPGALRHDPAQFGAGSVYVVADIRPAMDSVEEPQWLPG